MIDDMLLDALGSLFGGVVTTRKTSISIALTYEKYAFFSLSFGSIGIKNLNKIFYEPKKYCHKKSLKTKKEEEQELDWIINNKGCEEIYIPDDLLDPIYDYDFTDIDDLGRKFYRGGLEYKRPCGWKRYALKVTDKYDNTDWLDSYGDSNNDSEWAVSYHGTKITCAIPIVKEGLKPGTNNYYGVGVYCTPDISCAETYSEIFTSQTTNKQYKIVFQNRVNPKKIVYCESLGGPSDYWLVEDGKDIRPYGICIKEVKREYKQEIKAEYEEPKTEIETTNKKEDSGCFIF